MHRRVGAGIVTAFEHLIFAQMAYIIAVVANSSVKTGEYRSESQAICEAWIRHGAMCADRFILILQEAQSRVVMARWSVAEIDYYIIARAFHGVESVNHHKICIRGRKYDYLVWTRQYQSHDADVETTIRVNRADANQWVGMQRRDRVIIESCAVAAEWLGED